MLLYVALVLGLLALAWFLLWFTVPLRQSFSDPPSSSYRHTFVDYPSPTKANSQVQVTSSVFPSLFDPPTTKISLISPAYNEENRLGPCLDVTLEYMIKRSSSWSPSSSEFEIIVVDDGSKDKTTEVALQYSKKYSSNVVRVLTLSKNQGKGGAVQQGMLHARGSLLLMMDADGATNIEDLAKLEAELIKVSKDGHGVAVGSRAHLADKAVAKRKWYRNILMYGFHFAVSVIGGIAGVKDTQCGFKLFTRKTAQQLFFNQRLRRWCFDVELLHIAQRLGIPIAEVQVRWEEVPGSKLNLIESTLMMARDLCIIRFAYMFSIWSIHTPVLGTINGLASSEGGSASKKKK